METIKIDEFGAIHHWKYGELGGDVDLHSIEWTNGTKEYYKNEKKTSVWRFTCY